MKQQGPWNADTIRAARKARNLTQRQVADSLGCRQQTISEWEIAMYGPKNAYQKLLTMFFGTQAVDTAELTPTEVAHGL
jgi:DNA-binding transcriptional regulator YiaG